MPTTTSHACRWAIVSDIHGNLPALEAVVADARDADAFLNLGDIVSGPLWPRETAEWLMTRGWPTIAGNHERQLLSFAPHRMSASDRFAAAALTDAQWHWLRSLPDTLRPAPGLLCVHGAPGNDLQYLLETVTPAGARAATAEEIQARLGGVQCALLLCGHSHVPRCVKPCAIAIANPGSVGLQAYDDTHPHVHIIETGSPQARYALLTQEAAGWKVELRRVDYDFEAAAAQAERYRRPDWADALRTGRIGRFENDTTAT